MRKWMKAAAVAAALSMLVSIEALAVVSPSGTPLTTATAEAARLNPLGRLEIIRPRRFTTRW